ncbi:MAG: hypothetical protein ACYCSO_05820 [Cuniculiplasma sp.]
MKPLLLYTILIGIIIVGSLSLIFENAIFLLFITIPIIFGMDLSSDEMYDKIEDITGNKPGLLYGLTLFSFLTSFDEITVSSASIAEGYSRISLGTLLGSELVTLFIFLIILKLSKNSIERRISIILFLLPLYILFLLILDPFGIYVSFALTSAFVALSIFSFYFINEEEKKSNIKTTAEGEKQFEKWDYIELLFFILSIILLSIFLSKTTESIGSYLKIGNLNSGFIIPGILGSIPEIIVIKSSIRKKDSSSATGIIMGSSLIKGGILLPILIFAFGYRPVLSNYTFSLSLILLFILVTLMVLFPKNSQK